MTGILHKEDILSNFSYFAFLGFYNQYSNNQSAMLLVDLIYGDLQNSSAYHLFMDFAKDKNFLKKTYKILKYFSEYI